MVKISEQHPEHKIKLEGTGIIKLAQEVNQEVQQQRQLASAREAIKEGYRNGVVDLDQYPQDMKKIILTTFLEEFGPDKSKGTPPRFVGTGIIKINLEIMKEKGKAPSEENIHERTNDYGQKAP